MGRPRELTEEQRADLEARGFVPLEIWVIDRDSDAYRQEVARQLSAAAEADSGDPDIDDWIAQVQGNLWDNDAP